MTNDTPRCTTETCFLTRPDCPTHGIQCQLPAGHEGPHQAGTLEWMDCCTLHSCVNPQHAGHRKPTHDN